MLKIRYKLIFALVCSPMLASTSVAEQVVESVAQKIEAIQTQEETQKINNNEVSQIDAPKITEQIKQKLQKASEALKPESKTLTQELNIKTSGPAFEESKATGPLDALKNMEKFKVCSLGHNYNISNYEFIKHQQIEQKLTVINYKSQEDDKYNCEVKIISKDNQDVALKCWKGLKTNVNLSVFKLSYFVGNNYLFMQPHKNRLVMVKPIEHGTANTCPNNFKPIVKKKKTKSPVDTNPSGLAGLTF